MAWLMGILFCFGWVYNRGKLALWFGPVAEQVVMKTHRRYSLLVLGVLLLLTGPAVACGPGAPPVILALDATPAQITAGESTTLRWVVKEPDSVSIDQGIGDVAAVGNRQLSPASTIAYTLTATNSAGTVSKSVVVTVSTAPPPVPDSTAPVITDVSASSETETSAVVTWTTNEAGSSQVEYGRSAQYGSTTVLDEELVATHSATLSGLQPNTVYHFRVKSRDAAENEALSGDYVFATPPPKSPYVLELLWSEWGRRTDEAILLEATSLFIRGSVRNTGRSTIRSMACAMQCWSGDTLVKFEVDMHHGTMMPGQHYDFDIETADDPAVDNVTIEFTDSQGQEITLIVK